MKQRKGFSVKVLIEEYNKSSRNLSKCGPIAHGKKESNHIIGQFDSYKSWLSKSLAVLQTATTEVMCGL